MRSRLMGRLALATAAALLSWIVGTSLAAQAPGAAAAQAPADGTGRGASAAPSEPTPRLPDGIVNLGRVPGDLGELLLEFFSALIGDPIMPRLSQHAMHDEIRISADWRREMCIVLRREPEVS